MSLILRETKLGLIEKDAIYCYGMCKMTCVKESDDSSVQYKRLQFVEFLELIGRIAQLKYKSSALHSLDLVNKIELILDEVLALVEVQRKPVNIQHDEESESDDDY